MLCGLGFHSAGKKAVWNAGVGFSTCAHCGREIVRRPGRRWEPVPRGYRVVWKPVWPAAPTDANEYRDWSKPGSWITDPEHEPQPATMGDMLDAMTAQPTFTDLVSALPPLPTAATCSPGPDAHPQPPGIDHSAEHARADEEHRPVGRAQAILSRLRETIAHRLSRSAPAEEPASRGFRHLARRVGAMEASGEHMSTIVLSAICEGGTANDTMLMFAAMLQDELGGRLLIVDATLREDGISNAFRLTAVPGLSEARRDAPQTALELVQLLPRPAIFLMPAGLNPGKMHPAELPGLLPSLAAHFDRILIQQHAIFSDTRYLSVAAAADLVIVLAEEGASRMPDLARCHETFRANAIDRVGLLLVLSAAGSAS